MLHDRSVTDLLRAFDSAVSSRYRWDTQWRQISNLVAVGRPIQSRPNHVASSAYPGQAISDISYQQSQVYDSTAPLSAAFLASALHGLLTSPAIKWFVLKPAYRGSPLDRESSLWIQDAESLLMSVFAAPRLGFYSAIQEVYWDLVTYGTGVILVLDEDTIKFQSRPLSDFYLVNDHDGSLWGVFRCVDLTAVQASNQFGIDNLSASLKEELQKPASYDKTHPFVHAIFPSSDPSVKPFADRVSMPYVELYVDLKAKHVCSIRGYHEMPVAAPRWARLAGEAYGFSPAMSVLADIAMVNAMGRSAIRAAEKAIDPPLILPDEMFITQFVTMAGGINYRRPDAQFRASDILLPVGDPRISEHIIQQRRDTIRQAFFVDLLTLPSLDRMTATEVMQRRQDALQVMSPYITRLQSELLSPVIRRTLRILIRRGLLSQPPAALRAYNLDIDYVSPLAVSQRSSEVTSLQMWLNTMAPLVQAEPQVLRNLDSDEVSRGVADALNVNPRFFRDPRDVAQRREDDEQRLRLAQDLSAGRDLAAASKDASAAIKALGAA